MRIVISILAFILGIGCIAYSYIGSVLMLAEDVEQTANNGDGAGALAKIIEFIMSGEIPQLTSYLYGGALLIVLAVVNLLLGRGRDEDAGEED